MVATADKELFLEQFARFDQRPSAAPAWLHQLRQSAIERFVELGLPTARNEDWRFTSVAPLLQVPFELAEGNGQAVGPGELPASTGSLRLVFVNGRFVPQLSTNGQALAGVMVGSLAALLAKQPEKIQPYLAPHGSQTDRPFTALNTAFLHDGAIVIVPAGRCLEKPIEVVYHTQQAKRALMSHPRSLIVVGRGSQATVVERYLGGDQVYFTNAVTEIVLQEQAILAHGKLQEESGQAFHLATTQVRQGRASNFHSCYLSLGGSWVRNEVRVLFEAEGSEARLDGLYLASGRQHVDNFTFIDHARPHCTSQELYKGILDGQSQGVFNGKIVVRPDAQKTDARQANKVLLLSEDATINTKPQLEIFADDVKCTHGAAVGQLDRESIFYLQARGLDLAEARRLLTYAFANDIVTRFPLESIHSRLEQALMNRRLAQDRVVEEA